MAVGLFAVSCADGKFCTRYDGKFRVCAHDKRAALFQFDHSLNIEWVQEFPITQCLKASARAVALSGSTRWMAGRKDAGAAYLWKLNSSGEIQWSIIDPPVSGSPQGLCAASDGSAAWLNRSGGVKKFNSSGTELWDWSAGYSLGTDCETDGTNCWICSYNSSCSWDGRPDDWTYAAMWKLDGSGNVVWYRLGYYVYKVPSTYYYGGYEDIAYTGTYIIALHRRRYHLYQRKGLSCYSASTGAEIWSIDTKGTSPPNTLYPEGSLVTADNSHLWVYDSETGCIEKRNVSDGSLVWSWDSGEGGVGTSLLYGLSNAGGCCFAAGDPNDDWDGSGGNTANLWKLNSTGTVAAYWYAKNNSACGWGGDVLWDVNANSSHVLVGGETICWTNP